MGAADSADTKHPRFHELKGPRLVSEGILEHYGFEFVKEARHGLVYEHPELADAGARNEASIMISRGKELRRVYAGDVLKAVEALLAHRKRRKK